METRLRDFPERIKRLECLYNVPTLGLKLVPIPSFEDRPVNKTYRGYFHNSAESKQEDSEPQRETEKLRISKIPVSLIRIGSWQRVARDEDDIVAKFYYVKKNILWEFLGNGSKCRMEFKWDDVLAFNAISNENGSAVLQVELKHPPKFYLDASPCHQKHPQLELIEDFTGGHAATCRRHYLEFRPGALHKHYEKLLQSDSYLRQCSQNPFPYAQSLYFDPISDFTVPGFSSLHTSQFSGINPSLHSYQPQIPMPLELLQQPRSLMSTRNLSSPVSVMDRSLTVDRENSVENSRRQFQGHQDMVFNLIDSLPVDQITLANEGILCQSRGLAGFNEGITTMPNHDDQLIDNILDDMLNPRPLLFSDEKEYTIRAQTWEESFDAEQRFQGEICSELPFLALPQASAGEDLIMQNNMESVLMANEQPDDSLELNGLFCLQALLDENPMMNQNKPKS